MSRKKYNLKNGANCKERKIMKNLTKKKKICDTAKY